MATVHDLVRRLAGEERRSAPVSADVSDEYVEKLASAVEHLLAGSPSYEKVARAAAPAPATDTADALRDGLLRRLAAKQRDASVEDRSVKDTILARLRGMSVPASYNDANTADDEQDDALFYTDHDVADEDSRGASAQTKTAPEVIAPGEDAEPAAYAEGDAPTLADVLAASLGASEPDESATSGVKTAGVRGDVGQSARKAATGSLKSALLAKLGKEV